jgi:hypothetical protein
VYAHGRTVTAESSGLSKCLLQVTIAASPRLLRGSWASRAVHRCKRKRLKSESNKCSPRADNSWRSTKASTYGSSTSDRAKHRIGEPALTHDHGFLNRTEAVLQPARTAVAKRRKRRATTMWQRQFCDRSRTDLIGSTCRSRLSRRACISRAASPREVDSRAAVPAVSAEILELCWLKIGQLAREVTDRR